MNEREVRAILGKVGAIVTDGHFVYASGKHGAMYVNKDAIYPHTAETSRLCRAIAEQFANDNVEVVIAPAIGGTILSQWIACHLSEITGREVFGVYAEKLKKPGSPLWHICFGLRLLWKRIPQFGKAPLEDFVIKRGYDKIIAGKNVLVADDVLTTGGSSKKAIKATRAIGGNVVGLGVLCNRGGIASQDVANVPKLVALMDIKLDAWDVADCPLCKNNVPINENLGKGGLGGYSKR